MQRPFCIFVGRSAIPHPAFFSIEGEREPARSRNAVFNRRPKKRRSGERNSFLPRFSARCGPAKNKSLRWLKPPERLQKSFFDSSLANFGAQEFAVVFYTDASAGQEVGHCRNRFFGILGARANGKNKVSEREFGAWFEDLFGRFHDQS